MGYWIQRLLTVAAACVAVAVAILCGSIWTEEEYYIKVGLVCVLSLVFVICIDIARLKPANSHNLITLISHYGFIVAMRSVGAYFNWRSMSRTYDCQACQSKVLSDILSRNGNCEYGKRYNFNAIRSREEFVKIHPLCDYNQFAPYIKRMSDGHNEVLVTGKVDFFATTSGTTGKSKLFPCNSAAGQKNAIAIVAAYYNRLKDITLKRVIMLRLWHQPRTTSAGIPKGSKSLRMTSIMKHELWIPAQRFIYKEAPSYHVLALLALGEPQLGELSGVSSNLLYAFFKYIEHNSETLCNDLANGMLDSNVEVEDDIRQQINADLHADATRAEQVRAELRKGTLGLAKRLWPELTSVVAASTGTYSHCAAILAKTFTQGYPLVNYGHFASEACIGLSLHGNASDIYTLTWSNTFMEFIPKEQAHDDSPATFFMEQLEIGKEYELVVTTFAGLYRYRLGDMIKVVGHLNSVPTYQFQYRVGQLLNVCMERTPESLLMEAVKVCQKDSWQQQNITVHDFMATESMVLEPITGDNYKLAHYVVFIECNPGTELTDKHALELDDTLGKLHDQYKAFCDKGSIAGLKIKQLKPGTCDSFKQKLWDGSLNGQFKFPRILRRRHLLEHLLENCAD